MAKLVKNSCAYCSECHRLYDAMWRVCWVCKEIMNDIMLPGDIVTGELAELFTNSVYYEEVAVVA